MHKLTYAQRRRKELDTGCYPDCTELKKIALAIKDCAEVNNFTDKNKKKVLRLVQIAEAYEKKITNFAKGLSKIIKDKPKMSQENYKKISKAYKKLAEYNKKFHPDL